MYQSLGGKLSIPGAHVETVFGVGRVFIELQKLKGIQTSSGHLVGCCLCFKQ